MDEIWKDIPEYEGLYQVSNYGKIISLPKEWYNNKGYLCTTKQKIIKNTKRSNGYEGVALYKNKIKKYYLVHQLVAISFLNHKQNGHTYVIDHIDNNKLNNKINNLQIITQRLNSSKDIFKQNKSSKYIGVDYHKKSNKWRSRILINKKRVDLGYFNTEEEANKLYQKKLKELSI
jgi:hypothetical protein